MGDDRDDDFEAMREAMVETIAIHARLAEPHTGRGEIDDAVMAAMRAVPRHEFVPFEIQPYSYLDRPLPIGCGKTISQPYIVALMTDLLEVGPEHTVLEIGTGLGYQSAVLARLAARVFTVEFIDELADEAQRRLAQLKISNVEARIGDGALLQLATQLGRQRLAADQQPCVRSQLGQAREGIEQLAHVLVAADGTHERHDRAPGREVERRTCRHRIGIHVVVAHVGAVGQNVEACPRRGAGVA